MSEMPVELINKWISWGLETMVVKYIHQFCYFDTGRFFFLNTAKI